MRARSDTHTHKSHPLFFQQNNFFVTERQERRGIGTQQYGTQFRNFLFRVCCEIKILWEEKPKTKTLIFLGNAIVDENAGIDT